MEKKLSTTLYNGIQLENTLYNGKNSLQWKNSLYNGKNSTIGKYSLQILSTMEKKLYKKKSTFYNGNKLGTKWPIQACLLMHAISKTLVSPRTYLDWVAETPSSLKWSFPPHWPWHQFAAHRHK